MVIDHSVFMIGYSVKLQVSAPPGGTGNKQMNNYIAQRHNVTKLRKEVKILNFFVAWCLCA